MRRRDSSVTFLGWLRPRDKGERRRPSDGSPFSTRQLLLGVLLFVGLTAAGLSVIVRVSSPGQFAVLDVWRNVKILPFLVAIALAGAEAVLGGARVQVLAGHVQSDFRWRDGMLVHFYNAFAAGVTPLQAGSGPAQYYVLRRKGLRASRALAVLAVNWVGSMSGLVVLGVLGFLYLQLGSEDLAIGPVFRGLLITVFAFAAAAVVVILSPGLFGGSLPFARLAHRSRRGRGLMRAIDRYRTALNAYVRTGKRAVATNAALSWCMFLTRCLIGLAVLAAMGVSADALSAMSRQMLQFAVIYVTPSPGGSGVAELSTLGFMAGIVPPVLMVSYALLWRAATGYLGMAVGGCVVVLDLTVGRSR